MATAGRPADEPGLPLAGVELGGTKVVCMLAYGPDEIEAKVELPTRGPGETLSDVAGVLDGWRFGALGIGSFGPLDLASFSIAATPKAGWRGTSLAQLRRGRGIPVAIDTDVNGAALAEGRWGAARGLSSWAYITVGTGIGVGSVVGGRPVRGLGHSEAGHLRIPRGADDWPGICPFHGDCVEGLASGAAIASRAGAPADTLTDDHPVWTSVAGALAVLCHNLVLTSLPQRIIIGGGVGTARPGLLPMIHERLVASLAGYGPAEAIARDERFIVAPSLGKLAGPLGTIALASDALGR